MTLMLELPDETLVNLAVPARELSARMRLEFACGLYAQGLFSLAQAAHAAGMHLFVFGHELTKRGISRQIGDQEMEEDTDYVTSCIDRQ